MTDAKPTAVLKYPGAKNLLAPWIISFFPEHESYVEPFGGSAAVLLRKKPSKIEVYNDLNGELVNFFRVLRDGEKCRELVRLLELTPYAKEEYASAYLEYPSDSDVEKARKTYVKSFQGFGAKGLLKPNGWRRSSSGTETKMVTYAFYKNAEGLLDCVNRLHNVFIENEDAFSVIERYDSVNALFYLDPPYFGDFGKMYAVGSHEREFHERLIDAVLSIKGMAVLSGYGSDLYSDRLKGWKMEARETKNLLHDIRQEVLWLNPALQERLGRKAECDPGQISVDAFF